MSEIINLVIRLMPSGDELDLELPVFSTGKEIKEELLNANVVPRADQDGNPYIYELISKSANVRIDDDKALDDVGIKDGETLFFVPKLVAG